MGRYSRNVTLSPEVTDCEDAGMGSDGESSSMVDGQHLIPLCSVTSITMPVLEDGLSSGHTSDTDNNNPTVCKCVLFNIIINYIKLFCVFRYC